MTRTRGFRGTRAVLFAGAATIAVAACGGADGVPQEKHDAVLSQLTVANEELALADRQLALATDELGLVDQELALAIQDLADARAAQRELQATVDEVFFIDEDEQVTMARRQGLALLANVFVEFRNGPWDEAVLGMLEEPVAITGVDRISDQFEILRSAAAVSGPDSAEADYEYGVFGFEIANAMEQDLVDPTGG